MASSTNNAAYISVPKVSIGLPVYNGENFLEEAVDSILNQTFLDFELIISDNGSTDRTEQICRAVAARDDRVRYHRNDNNLGASWNFRKVFQLSSAPYFKWAAHDDICKPDFLQKCVEVLDSDESVVLCYTKTVTINSEGSRLRHWSDIPTLHSFKAPERFRACLDDGETIPIWGVIRAGALHQIRPLGDYPACDRPLLADLALRGRFQIVPEILFLHREHAQRSVRAYDFMKPHQAITWYDPKQQGRTILPEWRLLAEYISAIREAPVTGGDRIRCTGHMVRWLINHRRELTRDLFIVAAQVPVIGRTLGTIYGYTTNRIWITRMQRASRELRSLIPPNKTVILVGSEMFEKTPFAPWRTLPFTERDGEYWGLPESDQAAIEEVERMRHAGAAYLAFTWPTFWWFDYYKDLSKYLMARYSCVQKNDCLIVFDLS